MKPKDPKPGNPTDMMVFARGVSILAQREDLIAVARDSGSYQNEILTLNKDFVFKINWSLAEFYCRGHSDYVITIGVAGGVAVAVLAAATAMALKVGEWTENFQTMREIENYLFLKIIWGFSDQGLCKMLLVSDAVCSALNEIFENP